MDLAVQCILPADIMTNEALAELYCKELKIEKKDLYSRLRWISNYYEKFNSRF